MKKYILLIVLCVASLAAIAQETDDDPAPKNPKAKERINAARVAYITERLGLTPAEAEKFWPLYREYATKRHELRQQLNNAKRNGEPPEKLLDLELKLKQDNLDLEKDYSGKMRQTVKPEKLMRLRGAEEDFKRIIYNQLQQRQLNNNKRELQREKLLQRQQQRNN